MSEELEPYCVGSVLSTEAQTGGQEPGLVSPLPQPLSFRVETE